jgi:peptide/nickel transport system substrate-binding protein
MKRNVMLLLSLLLVASVLLTACQPAAPETIIQTVVVTQVVAGTPEVKIEQKVVTATPVPPTAAPTKPAAKASDTVVLALQQEPDTLHPGIGSMMARTIVLSSVLVGCVGQNEVAKWVPLGCETVPTVDNGGAVYVNEGADKHLEVTYKIKKGWRWTDGTPVTAKDAVYQWKLSMDPEFEIADRSGTEKLFDVVAVDDATIKYVFLSEKQAKEAAAGTLKGNIAFDKFAQDYKDSGFDAQSGPVVSTTYFAYGGWWPEHILGKIAAKDQAASDYAKKPVGDGPYVVKEWKQGQEIDLEKSDKPFPLGDAKIKTIIYRFFAESAAVKAALQNGEIDAVTSTGGLTVNDAPDLDKIDAMGLYKSFYQQGYAWEHIDLNTTAFPFDDVKVRQALYYATDRKSLVDKLYYGKQSTTNLPVPPFSWSYTDDITKYDFSLDKAKALLVEAGWDCKASPCTKQIDGKAKNLEITLITTDRADRQAVAQVIQQQWKKAGFGVNLQFLYGRGLFATASAGGPLNSRTFQAAIYTWITGDDPDFGSLYTCASVPNKENNYAGQNTPGWCNKAADEAQNKQIQLLSLDQRKPLLATFYKEWTKDVPVVPLFSNTTVTVARVGFKNWKPGPTSASADAWNAWEWELTK